MGTHSKSLFFCLWSSIHLQTHPLSIFHFFVLLGQKRWVLLALLKIEAPKMKRSPASSCSSSTSSVGFEAPIEKRRPKHPRRNNLKSQKCKQNQTTTGGRRSSIYRGVTRFGLSHCFFNSLLNYSQNGVSLAFACH